MRNFDRRKGCVLAAISGQANSVMRRAALCPKALPSRRAWWVDRRSVLRPCRSPSSDLGGVRTSAGHIAMEKANTGRSRCSRATGGTPIRRRRQRARQEARADHVRQANGKEALKITATSRGMKETMRVRDGPGRRLHPTVGGDDPGGVISVPTATMQQAKKCAALLTRPSPNSTMPMKPASRKKAVRASYMKRGPSTFDRTGEAGPIGADLIAQDHAGDDAHAEGQREELHARTASDRDRHGGRSASTTRSAARRSTRDQW